MGNLGQYFPHTLCQGASKQWLRMMEHDRRGNCVLFGQQSRTLAGHFVHHVNVRAVMYHFWGFIVPGPQREIADAFALDSKWQVDHTYEPVALFDRLISIMP